MKRKVVRTKAFANEIKRYASKRKLSLQDLEKLEDKLVKNPDLGDLISGTGGVRKVRLKSVSKGTRGGFRVCYFDDPPHEELILLDIYPKNEQEDLTADEKKGLKQITDYLKSRK